MQRLAPFLICKVATGTRKSLMISLLKKIGFRFSAFLFPTTTMRTSLIIWSGEEKGNFSVKSCYRLLCGDLGQQSGFEWTKIWKLAIPPKVKNFIWQACSRSLPIAVNLCLKRVPCPTVCNLCAKSPETVDHLLIHCEFAKKCWRNFQTLSTHEDSHLKDWIIENMNIMEQSLFCQFLVTCWKIWEVRNQKLWNNQSAHPRTMVDSARSFLEAWSTVQKPNHSPRSHSAHERWKNPPEGRLKLNVDAAINSNFKATGLGCILRNSLGEFVAARGQNWLGCYQPKLAEAISVREALKWLKERNFDNVIVETDALQFLSYKD